MIFQTFELQHVHPTGLRNQHRQCFRIVPLLLLFVLGTLDIPNLLLSFMVPSLPTRSWLAEAEAHRRRPLDIQSIFPSCAAVKTPVTIKGRGFGGQRVRITVGGVVATVIRATDRTVVFTIPNNVPSGLTTVVATNPQRRSDSIAIRIKGPEICSNTVDEDCDGQINDPDVCPVINHPPTARAGSDQTTPVGTTVQLDGSTSSDPDGDLLTYQWTLAKPAGSTATLTNATSAFPSLKLDKAGSYTVRLVVHDGKVPSLPDTVILSTLNSAPIANAGPDQSGQVGDTISFDGSQSVDVDGDVLTYLWSVSKRPSGGTATLTNPTTVTPQLTLDKHGEYTVQLIVNDGKVNSIPDTTMISTINSPPVADAGVDQTGPVGTTIILDGSTSSDVDGDPLTYEWSFSAKPVGSTATLQNPTSVTPSFTIDKAGTYVVQLIVRDGTVDSEPDTATVSTVNSQPVANTGVDQTPVVGTTVKLDGSASTDVDGDVLTYAWALTAKPAGSNAILSDPEAVHPTLTIDKAGTYIAQLIVNDGKLDSKPDTVTLNTVNSKPLANAGPDQHGALGTTITLDGTGSSDVDGDTLLFQWALLSQPVGSTAAIQNPTTKQPSFTLDKAGAYVVQLIVNDGTVDSEPDTVVVSTVNSKPVADAGEDQTGTVNQPVQLDGSGSTDADDDPLIYQWSLASTPENSTATLSDLLIVNPTFTPDQPGLYIAQLIVSDGKEDADPDTTSITITVAPEDLPPVADAGPDQTVEVGDVVHLNGGKSKDPEGKPITFAWTFALKPASSTASLTGATSATPSFMADVTGTYTVQLVVNDGRINSPPDTVTIIVSNVSNCPPNTTQSCYDGPPGTAGVGLCKAGTRMCGSDGTPGVCEGQVLPTLEIPDNGIDEDCNGSDGQTQGAFSLTAAPAAAEVLSGQSVSHVLRVSGVALTQLASLDLTGLPAGVTGSLSPQQVAAGQSALLTISVPNGQAQQTLPFSVSASASVNGKIETHSVALTLKILPVTTSFVGRTVVADDLQTPLAGVSISLVGRDGDGKATGCMGETVSDAAGNFMFTNLPPECTSGQLIRYDGTTATSPSGKYAGVDLFYDVVANQVTTSPVLIHLPRIDNKEFVCVQQNAPQDQTSSFQTIPNMTVTVYAGTTFTPHPQYPPFPGRCPTGSFALIAIDVPVDRLPDAMPPGMPEVMPFIVAFQPPNAVASQPVAVSFPNLLNTAPGTNLTLMTLDPTKGVMVNYGSGTVSANGTQVIPDLNPATPGHRYGLVHFDWHGPAPIPPPQTSPTPEICPITKGKLIDLSSGLEVIRETDIALNGLRGSIFLQRVYRTLSDAAEPFGIGTSHNYGYRLNTNNPQGAAVVNLIMPDGNQFPLAAQPGIRPTLTNLTIPLLRGVEMTVSPNNEVDLRWKDGTVFHFVPMSFVLASVLDSITDLNGNRTTLVRKVQRIS